MAKKKTTKTKAKSVRGSKVRVTSGWRKEVEELGYTALQLERERKKMHAFRDRIGTNWELSLALGGIVRMKFTDGLTPDSTVFFSVNSARRLASGITEMSKRVPPEDECEDTEDFSEGIEYVAKPKRGRPKKEDEDDSALESEDELMGLNSYLFGRITPVTADGAHLVRPGKPDKIDVDLHYWRSAWPMHDRFERILGSVVNHGEPVEVSGRAIKVILSELIDAHEALDRGDRAWSEETRQESLYILLNIKALALVDVWLSLEDAGYKRAVFYRAGF